MWLINLLRKAIGYVLMAMGASSSQALKKTSTATPGPKTGPRR